MNSSVYTRVLLYDCARCASFPARPFPSRKCLVSWVATGTRTRRRTIDITLCVPSNSMARRDSLHKVRRLDGPRTCSCSLSRRSCTLLLWSGGLYNSGCHALRRVTPTGRYSLMYWTGRQLRPYRLALTSEGYGEEQAASELSHPYQALYQFARTWCYVPYVSL
ncbi:hypothetical protein EXIGLDRAFT_354129 [Exidia glandulosa HHB12029]|uniref:Uncharacterized protein n=1 Tax=Exidia glandulosa HHB12029 TaxID=1314781 RepID=A0A165LDK4_EXIGL|nr:hypothetical protein EXIGLDRAFT_354129 [Exidia glandulosa HHB12029]